MKKEVEEIFGEIQSMFEMMSKIELVEVDEEEGVVRVNVEPVCVSCMPTMIVVKEVEKALKERVYNVQKVEMVR